MCILIRLYNKIKYIKLYWKLKMTFFLMDIAALRHFFMETMYIQQYRVPFSWKLPKWLSIKITTPSQKKEKKPLQNVVEVYNFKLQFTFVCQIDRSTNKSSLILGHI